MFNPQAAIQILQKIDALQHEFVTMLGPLFNGALTTMTELPQPLSERGISGGLIRSRKHSMSAAQRKRLSVMAKRRWATARKAGKTSLKGRG